MGPGGALPAEGAPPAAETVPHEVEPEKPFRFTGTGTEFFGIWVINILLTLVTLGVYSAWATVRTRRYFHGHTVLDGHPFDYLADPIAILKGRSIVVLLMVLWGAAPVLFPTPGLNLGGWIVAAVAVPWIVVRALTFRAVNTQWRHIRFGFDGHYGEALVTFVGLPIVAFFSAGLAYPYYVCRRQRFIVGRSRFGDAPFRMTAGVGAFYGVYLGVGLAWVVGTALVLALGTVPAMNTPLGASGNGLGGWNGAALASLGVLLTLALWTFATIRAQVTNLTWNGTTNGTHRFVSTLTTGGLLGLYLTNWVAVVFTFGLFLPWARVRVARYRMDHLSLVPDGPLDTFIAAHTPTVGATGAELDDALDIDLGL